jgi:iron complex transport system substrate-binding protein
MMRATQTLPWLTMLCMVVVGGCGGGAPPPPSSHAAAAAGRSASTTLRDWVQDPHVVAAEQNSPAMRIVSTAPSATEICCALGLRQQIVGRTRFCDYPPGISHVPVIGAMDETSAELLLNLKPSVVLVAGSSRATVGRLAELGIRPVSLPDRTLADVFTAIRIVGELTARPQTAEQLCGDIEHQLASVAQRYAPATPRRVLLLTGTLADPPAPPFVAGPGSLYDDLLRRAGHENAADQGVRAYAPLSLEAIVRIDPEVIIELDAAGQARPAGDADAVSAWTRLGPLRAVTTRRIHVLAGQQHFIPGPRVAQTFEAMCRKIGGSPDE